MLSVEPYPFKMPWFMLDISNFQLITGPTIPGDITDTKAIVLAEQPVPGMNYQPILPGGGGNRKLSFRLPLVRRNNTVGNVLMLKQFDRLRNRTTGFARWSSSRFSGYPKVLYYWGVGSMPLVYWVSKCDAVHKTGWVNQAGNPQVSDIEIELVLDETHPLYKAEELFRFTASILGESLAGYEAGEGIVNGGKAL